MIKKIDWQNLSSKDKKKIASTRPMLIMGSIPVTTAKIKKILKKLPSNLPIIWGNLKNKYIQGLENSPQFKTLTLSQLQKQLTQVQVKKKHKKLQILHYHQRYSHYLIKELKPSAVILFHDSWHKAFHYSKMYYYLTKLKIKYKLTSPFLNETEALFYQKKMQKKLISHNYEPQENQQYSHNDFMQALEKIKLQSFDHIYQTSCLLAKDSKFLLSSYNRIVPYPIYARHFGSAKEKHFSPPHDLNHFDTNHAEVELLIKAQHQQIDLSGTSLYINLMPCPTCARMIARTNIAKIFYHLDHSEGYAFELLENVGKKIVRI